jgi:hypothetical protein
MSTLNDWIQRQLTHETGSSSDNDDGIFSGSSGRDSGGSPDNLLQRMRENHSERKEDERTVNEM